MVSSEKSLPARSTWLARLSFCVLGLTAALCGLFLPQSLRGLRELSAAVTTSDPAPLSSLNLRGDKGGEKKDALEYDPPALPEMPLPGPMLLRLVLGTIIILILCIVTLWAGKRWVRPLAAPLSENRKLRVVELLPLGGRCTVFLLQADETSVLVGVDQAGIKSLVPLPQPFDNALAEITGETNEPEA